MQRASDICSLTKLVVMKATCLPRTGIDLVLSLIVARGGLHSGPLGVRSVVGAEQPLEKIGHLDKRKSCSDPCLHSHFNLAISFFTSRRSFHFSKSFEIRPGDTPLQIFDGLSWWWRDNLASLATRLSNPFFDGYIVYTRPLLRCRPKLT